MLISTQQEQRNITADLWMPPVKCRLPNASPSPITNKQRLEDFKLWVMMESVFPNDITHEYKYVSVRCWFKTPQYLTEHIIWGTRVVNESSKVGERFITILFRAFPSLVWTLDYFAICLSVHGRAKISL